MSNDATVPVLTSDLDWWAVDLKNGGTVLVRAHAVNERDDHYCFVALMAGSPPYFYELMSLPVAEVESYEGPWRTPPEARPC